MVKQCLRIHGERWLHQLSGLFVLLLGAHRIADADASTEWGVARLLQQCSERVGAHASALMPFCVASDVNSHQVPVAVVYACARDTRCHGCSVVKGQWCAAFGAQAGVTGRADAPFM